ncbi:MULTISPECIES: hypothetical protein [unclassified Nocardiopsis]|uniref:hypothetical protein n=1 Tax=Nocardiopsis TaxID=2013 RepID=UPI00387ADBE8
MNLLLAELGKKGAEHWWSLLALPGVLFLLAVAGSASVGFVGTDLLTDVRAAPTALTELEGRARGLAGSTTVVVVVLVAIALAGHAAAVAARFLSLLVRAVWLSTASLPEKPEEPETPEAPEKPETPEKPEKPGTSEKPETPEKPEKNDARRRWTPGRVWDRVEPRRRAIRRRQRRWDGRANDLIAQNRVSLVRPRRPTWMGDRMEALARRVYTDYGLDVSWTWPRLVLLLPDRPVEMVDGCRADLDRAVLLGGWGVLYLAAAPVIALVSPAWWIPAAVGVICLVTAWRQARSAVDNLATLVESCYDLYHRELLRAFPGTGPAEQEAFDSVHGLDLTVLFRKGR